MIDAAEFVGPYLDRQLGLQRAAKYYYTTGWHETATGSELIINKAKWNSLPPDLKAIVENACAACNVISEAWCQKNNAEAMEDLIKNQGVIAQPLPDPIVEALRDANAKIIAENVAKDPLTKKVNDSYQVYLENSGSGRATARLSTTARSSRADVASAEQLADGIDTFIDAVGRVTAWSSFALAAVMGGNVLLRYVFHTGTVWSQELEWHLMAPICLFGMSYALRHGEHVRVDVLFASFSPRSKNFVELMSSALLMVISLIVIWLSISYVMQSWSVGEGSANPGGIPARYILKSLIPIGFALMLLQAFADAIRSYLAWRRAVLMPFNEILAILMLVAFFVLLLAGIPVARDARDRWLGVRLSSASARCCSTCCPIASTA